MEEKTTTCVNLITGDREDRYVCGNCGTVFYIEDGRFANRYPIVLFVDTNSWR